jgi:hypothetical protein
MNRRSWLGRMLGCLAGAVGFGRLTASETVSDESSGLGRLTEKNSLGSCVAQAYRKTAEGKYCRVQRCDLKPGDEFVMLGVDEDVLWKVAVFKVGPRGFFVHPDGVNEAVEIEGKPTACLIL